MATATLIHWPVGLIASVHGRWAPMLVLAIALGCWATGVSAEPVTFAFEAEVTEIARTNEMVELPFAIDPGDQVNGLLRFEPIFFGQRGDVTKLAMQLGDHSFSVEMVPLITRNDYLHPANGLEDSIAVGCSTTDSCELATSTVNGVDVGQLRLSLTSQNVGAIDFGDNLGDPAVWNKFQFVPPDDSVGFGATRYFVLELGPSTNGNAGTLLITGKLGPMTVLVPEPYSLVLLLGASAFGALTTRFRFITSRYSL